MNNLTSLIFILAMLPIAAVAQPSSVKNKNNLKMKVEIWSDVICPFCYIGKRTFEMAMAQMPQRENIEVIWKSFQLQPDLITDPSKNTIEHLAQSKGWTMAYTKNAVSQVLSMAQEVGLQYNFDKAVVANSFDAHRLSHYAAQHNKGNEMEEQLFKAYFIDGKNTADHATLTQLAAEIGLNESEVKDVLSSNKYADAVRQDIYEASQVGVSGVPFFVFNNKYAVSGAQESRIFLEVLQKSFSEWNADNGKSSLQIKEGAVCTPQGECK